MKYLTAMLSTLALVFAVLSFIGKLNIDNIGAGVLYLVISLLYFIVYQHKK